MRRFSPCYILITMAIGSVAFGGQSSPDMGRSESNIALHKSYALSASPNNTTCADKGDLTELTDGVRTTGSFWTRKTTVGWQHQRQPISITIDLGKVEPIAGAALGTGAGSGGVTWPASIVVSVSEEGKDFYVVGDLTQLAEGTLPMPYGQNMIYTYRTDKLATKGRYIRFDVVPSGMFFFCDEIEVYRGNDHFLQNSYSAQKLSQEFLVDKARLTQLGCYRRIRTDWETVRDMVEKASFDPSSKAEILRELDSIRNELEQSKFPSDMKTFRAIVPFNGLHRRVFQVYSRLMKAAGVAPLTLWHSEPYKILSLFDKPGQTLTGLEISLMRNEKRAEVFNITNSGRQDATVNFRIEKLPADLIFPFEVQYVDTREGKVIASALVALKTERGIYTTIVPAGMTRQIWLRVDTAKINAGKYRGRISLMSASFEQGFDIAVDVADLRIPDRLDIQTSTWDYIHDKLYAITADNQASALTFLRGQPIDGVWAASASIPLPKPADFDSQGNLVGKIDFSRWDGFIRTWPDQPQYMTWANISDDTFAGRKMGTAEFDRALSQWARAWADHNRELGLKPGQVATYFTDEPQTEPKFHTSYFFGKAFQAGTKDILLFTDPNTNALRVKFGPEMLRTYDVICFLLSDYRIQKESDRMACQQLAQQGKQVWFYSCSWNTRMFNAAYFRLQPWHCLANGAVGSHFWALGDTGGTDSWNDYTAVGLSSCTPLYIGKTSVTTSKHWEAMIEGLMDYQYLIMLRDRIAEIKNTRNNSALLQKAQGLAATLPQETLKQIVEQFGYYYDQNSEDNPSQLAEKARLKVLHTLLKLQGQANHD